MTLFSPKPIQECYEEITGILDNACYFCQGDIFNSDYVCIGNTRGICHTVAQTVGFDPVMEETLIEYVDVALWMWSVRCGRYLCPQGENPIYHISRHYSRSIRSFLCALLDNYECTLLNTFTETKEDLNER